MCVFYHTCVEKSQHLSVGFSDTYLVISTHVCNKTHQCGKSHIAALCVEVGFTKQVWKKPNMCGNTHIYYHEENVCGNSHTHEKLKN